MRYERVKYYCQKLGIKLVGGVSASGWVQATCPLAPFTHESGGDTRPSFGICCDNKKRSHYYCFACGHKGSLSNLCFEMARAYNKPEWVELGNAIEKEENTLIEETFLDDLPEWEQPKEEKEILHIVDKKEAFKRYLSFLWSSEAVNYFRNVRHFDDSWGAWAELRWDEKEKRILFPIYNIDKQLLGFNGRAIYPDIQPKTRDYEGLQKRKVLLGEHLLKSDKQNYVIITEGPFDYLRLRSYGLPAVALLGSVLTDEKATTLKKLGKTVIWCTDNDLAGQKAIYGQTDVVTGEHQFEKGGLAKLKGYVEQMTVVFPEGINDPDELSEEQAKQVINSATFFVDFHKKVWHNKTVHRAHNVNNNVRKEQL